MNTIAPEPQSGGVTLQPEKKKRDAWDYLWRGLVIVLGLMVGLIIAVGIGLATGWISVGC